MEYQTELSQLSIISGKFKSPTIVGNEKNMKEKFREDLITMLYRIFQRRI